MRQFFFIFLIAFSSLSFPQNYDWNGSAKVTLIEPGYLPGRIAFLVDANVGPCTAGSWLTYYGKGSNPDENVKLVYSSILTAFTASYTLNIYGKNDCTIYSIHLTK